MSHIVELLDPETGENLLAEPTSLPHPGGALAEAFSGQPRESIWRDYGKRVGEEVLIEADSPSDRSLIIRRVG